MAGDDVTIQVRANSQQAQRAFRELKSEVAGLKGTLVPLASAAAPVTAAFGAAAVKAGGATTAVAAFGVAVAGQVPHLSAASDAQKKYNDAVTQYGRGSKQAAEAQRAAAATLATMPQATARAAVALGTLKDGFQEWSDSLAGFTMAPVEKSFTLLGQVIPKLTPMVRGASEQLDRLVSVAGGAMATPGFDALADKVSTFANESLQDAVDGAIHFARVLSEGGGGSGPIRAFMEYAEQNGPAVRETLSTIGDAVTTLVEAAADAGPGMLTLVNAAAGLVAALPPQLVATVMQLAVGLKLVTLAGAGAAAISGGIAALGAQIVALRAASAAAGGGMAGLAAAFGTLSTAAKATLIASGIGIIVVALSQLAQMGKQAPADVDKLSTSLRTLGDTGKVTGEAARVFGKDLSGLADSLQKVIDPKGLDQFQQSIVSFFGTDSTPVKDAKENIDGLDKALAGMVKSGQADLAADALDTLTAKMKDQGFSTDEIRGQLDDYKAALADQAFEQQLAAESMGIFGAAAQDTSAKLEAQQGAADGLRASILALNDVNRSAHDAQTQFEEALDGLTASFKEHGATLSADTEAGRQNRDAMSAAAAAQDELLASGIAAGDSLASMTKKSETLRAEMMRLATEAFDGNKQKATEYVNTLLGTPSEIKTLVKLEREEAISGLKSVQAEIEATPGAKSVKVDTLNGAAIAALEKVGLKTRQLPDGQTEVFTVNGQSLGSIGAVLKALKNLNGKTATTWTYNKVQTQYSIIGSIPKGKSLHDVTGATGGLFTGSSFKHGYADGGRVTGPGTGTSDDVFAPWLSAGEFVVKKASVDKYGEKFMMALNEGRLDMPRFAKGGKVSKQAKAEAEARAGARSDLTVSHFGQMAGYKTSEIIGQLARPDSLHDLVGALSKWRNIIKQATHGAQEKGLLKALDSAGKKLLAWEKQLGKVEASLSKARDKLNSLKDAASSLAGSVKSGILSGANITRAAGAEDSRVTINTILSQMQGSAANAKEFDAALKELKKRGLSGALLEQIASAGVEGGGLETAQALLGGSSAQIKQLNQLQSQITTAATSAGKVTADAVYGAAIKAQTKLVNDLKQQQEKLVKSMDSLAKAMEKMIEKAFGKKAAGGIVGMAAAGGIRSNRTWVGEQGPELLDLPVGSRVWSNPDSERMAGQAWASMLNEPRGGRAYGSAPAGGGSMRPIIVHQTITLDGRVVARQIFDPLREEIAHRGGSVQKSLGWGSG